MTDKLSVGTNISISAGNVISASSTISTDTSAITVILSVPQGGTGLASIPTGRLLYGNGTSTIGNVSTFFGIMELDVWV
jgi:hypothetical protein